MHLPNLLSLINEQDKFNLTVKAQNRINEYLHQNQYNLKLNFMCK